MNVRFRGTPKESKMVELSVEGKGPSEIAKILDAPLRTVEDAKRANREVIEKKIEDRRLQVHRHADRHFEEMLDAAAQSAKDPENRNQPSSLRNYGELLGMIGKNGVNVHVGDVVTNNTQINLDPEVMARMAREYDPEEHAKLAKKLGLG